MSDLTMTSKQRQKHKQMLLGMWEQPKSNVQWLRKPMSDPKIKIVVFLTAAQHYSAD